MAEYLRNRARKNRVPPDNTMWIYLEHEANCINTDHVSRLYVEPTGSGAALKADLSGKTIMLGYYDTRDAARAALSDLIMRRETGAAVIKLGK